LIRDSILPCPFAFFRLCAGDDGSQVTVRRFLQGGRKLMGGVISQANQGDAQLAVVPVLPARRGGFGEKRSEGQARSEGNGFFHELSSFHGDLKYFSPKQRTWGSVWKIY